MYEQIIYEVDNPVATITLNRPEKLNAVTDRMMQEIRHALADAERNEDVVGIVLTGAGRGFCSGADMSMLQDIGDAGGDLDAMRDDTEFRGAHPGDASMGADFEQGFTYLLSVRKPIIAAINGPCAGVGFSIAMFCDMRFISEAGSFTTAFAPLGLVAEHGMSWVLPRLVGTSRALDIMWSSRKIEGREAHDLGLASRVFAPAELLEETQGYIRGLAERSSPTSLMHMKQQIYEHLMLPLGESMTETHKLIESSVAEKDFMEGVTAFVQRRPPNFPRLQIDE
jgi:enoyl-CoA hydratase/carnithine racemase